MIEQNGYRLNSVRTPDEVSALAALKIRSLAPDEREAIQYLLDQGHEPIHFAMAMDLERPIPSPEQWLNDPYYGGVTGDTLFAPLREDFLEIFRGAPYSEINLCGSTGWGKSTLAAYVLSYMVGRLLCYRSPAKSFGLTPTDRIVIAMMSVTAKVAAEVCLSKFKQVVSASPFLCEVGSVKMLAEKVVFASKAIDIRCYGLGGGDKSENAALGTDLFAFWIDEANFIDPGRSARMMQKLLDRVNGRFGDSVGFSPGAGILTSSARDENDVTYLRVKENFGSKTVFVRERNEMDVKPKFQVPGLPVFHVLVGSGRTHSRLIENAVDMKEAKKLADRDPDCVIVPMPMTYLEAFRENLEDSIRNVAGYRIPTGQRFFRDEAAVYAAFGNDREACASGDVVNLWSSGGKLPDDFQIRWETLAVRKEIVAIDGTATFKWVPLLRPSVPRRFRIDLSKNQDRAALTIAHVSKEVLMHVIRSDGGDSYVVVERHPFVYVDFCVAFQPPKGALLNPEVVRSVLYQFRDKGFVFSGGSVDQYQSVETQINLSQRLCPTKELSVDRTPDAYRTLRDLFGSHRISIPPNRVLREEIVKLEWRKDVGAGKVDHPVGGSKDIADTLAGVVHELVSEWQGSVAGVENYPLGAVDDGDKAEDLPYTDDRGRRIVAPGAHAENDADAHVIVPEAPSFDVDDFMSMIAGEEG